MLIAGGWAINLGRGVPQVGFEGLPLGGVSTEHRAELETPNPMTIPPGTEAIVPAQLWANLTWWEPCGLVEPLAG